MEFWRLADPRGFGGVTELIPTYDYTLSWVGGLLAVFAGFALFPTLARIRSSRTPLSRRSWMLGGAFTMGVGFWGTQNMALLGFSLPTSFHYDPATGFLALLPVVAGCAISIRVLADTSRSFLRLAIGALSLALGLAGMHYTLMESINGDLLLFYNPSSVAMSLLLGFGFSLVALYVNRSLDDPGRQDIWRWLAGGLVFGVTVLGSHFSAMAGVSYFDDPAIASESVSTAPAFLIPLIAGCVLIIVVAYWLGSLIDGRLAEASASVRRSEARHRAVIDTMLDAHLVVDSHSTVISANPAAEVMFDWPAGELVGQPVTVLMNAPGVSTGHRWKTPDHSTDLRLNPARRWVHADGGRRRDGSCFPMEIAISPFFVDGERFVSCVVRDLSDRWDTEARMRRLAAAIEQAGDAICIMGTDQRIQYVNPQYERQTGFTADEVTGTIPARSASAETLYKEIWDTAGSGKVWAGQVRSRRRDGSVYEEELTLTPVFTTSGAVSGYVAVMRDVTRRQEAELERSRLAEALRHCTDSIEILDSQGRIVYVNAAFEESTGQRLAEIRGCRPEALSDYAPAGESYDEMTRAVRASRPWSGTLKSVSLNGDFREEEVTVSPMRDARGQVSGYVVVKRDITRRRRSEALVQQRQRLESIGRLADGIAHELSTPISILDRDLGTLERCFGNLDRLLTELSDLGTRSGPVPPATIAACLQSADAAWLHREIGGALTRSVGNARQVAGIVHAMHEISHENADRTDVDINRAIRSAITVTAAEWRPVAEIRTELDPDLPAVPCWAAEVGVVLLNLLLNAAQAVAAANGNGIRGKGLISISTRRLTDWVEIRVSDSGNGVSAAMRQQLFDPGQLNSRGGKRHGLALAHEIITQRHGGTIALDDTGEHGEGASFIIRLPLIARRAGNTSAAA